VRQAEEAMIKAMDSEFDRPTPFTKKATLARFGNASRGPTGEIIIKDKQAEYLNIHDKGGADKPRRRAHAIGVSIKRDQYGNPRKEQRKVLYQKASQKGSAYFIATGKKPRDKHLKPGLYGRGISESKDYSIKSRPVLIFYHTKIRKYRKRWHPKAVFRTVAKRVFELSMARRMREGGLI